MTTGKRQFGATNKASLVGQFQAGSQSAARGISGRRIGTKEVWLPLQLQLLLLTRGSSSFGGLTLKRMRLLSELLI